MFSILRRLHRDERGKVSYLAILVLAMIALPALLLLFGKYIWPRYIKDLFYESM